jgi:HK97 family phage major capsid protein
VVAVPFELLQDSTLNIESIVTTRLQQRIARIQNRKFTLGTGTAEPKGVVVAAAAGKVGTTGQTLNIIYDDLVDLQHAVDPAYRQLGCEFMLNDNSLKVVRKIKDTQGRPIFVPGYEVGVPGGAPDTLLGTNININQHMADMAANAKSVLYGYFKAYQIRDVMAYTLFRFTDSAYAKLGQVGFLAWARAGGTYTDVGKSLAYYQNSAT